ncbi:MAG: tetratricopeptide repeat protein [Planctomycetota bacterium]|jgi:tetratricopeptide (TPR) repeat protein
MHRFVIVSILLACVAAPAFADVLVIEQNKKIRILGLPSEIGGRPINLANYKAFLNQSDGVVVAWNYDGVDFKKSEKATKKTTYPIGMVKAVHLTFEPEALLDAYDFMSTGNYSAANSAFREVMGNADEYPVYRFEAMYQIGMCFFRMGQQKQAIGLLQRWDPKSHSKLTPQTYSDLAVMLTAQKQYKAARAWYKKISTLERISPAWAYAARLGWVKVDIAERKFSDAEQKAKQNIGQLENKPKLIDPLALAYALAGEAIVASGAKGRFPEAQELLEKAMKLQGVSDRNMAYVCARLGDALYAQGKPRDARFPYMRIVTLYPESVQVPHGLRNAGQCFIDLHQQELNRTNQVKADEYLIKGMKLLGECAGRHKTSGYYKEAARVYNQHKADYDAAVKRQEGVVTDPTAPDEKEKPPK